METLIEKIIKKNPVYKLNCVSMRDFIYSISKQLLETI